jgi:CHAT domain-containing protein/tetratricopeptide (TPR) repeat protein
MGSLENLIEEITSLPLTPDTLGRRIRLCDRALKQVNREIQPVLWAQLHVELGLCLHLMSNADRARHLEEAMGHFQEALSVFTCQGHPEAWVETVNNLAVIYTERIRGNRAENLEKAIHLLKQALELCTPESAPEERASTQYNLANAYTQRLRGDRAENLEQAIALYRKALRVWKKERYSFAWAQAQKGIGAAYFSRVRGPRSANLKTAIACYEEALTVWTRRAYPEGWAEVQEGLGLVWRNYMSEDPAKDVERAIACHQAALEVWTPEKHPWDWARVQHNLGAAWRSRIHGNHTENLEEAIRCYQRALTVRKRDANPEAWAETNYNLAIAHSARLSGESVEEAIRLHQQVLEVYTRQDFPLAWARTQAELGNDYIRRIQGERATNLEWAIKHNGEALRAQSRETCPWDWAITQQSLAVAYSERLVGNRASNLREAINHYERALRVFDKGVLTRWATVQTSLADTLWKLGNLERFEHPEQAADDFDRAVTLCREVVRALDPLPRSHRWALAHYNLGNAYSDRINGDREENQERAIEHYTQALKFYTPQAFPTHWANTHNNLAVTYWERQRGIRAENLARATKHFEQALEVADPEALPIDARRAARNFANLYFTQRDWVYAFAVYRTAMDAGERLYRAGLSAESKAIEIAENAVLYRHAAFSAACLGKTSEALLTLEHGKTRLLTEALRLRVPRPAYVPDEAWDAFEQAGVAVRTAQLRSGILLGEEHDLVETLTAQEKVGLEASATLDNAIAWIREYAPDFLKDLELATVLDLLPDERMALVSFCITNQGSMGFVVSHNHNGAVQTVDVPDFTQTELNHLLFEPDAQGHITGGWVGNYLGQYTKWHSTMEQVLFRIGKRLFAPVLAALPSGTEEIIFLPSGGLFLLPLHAVPFAGDGPDRVCDRYQVSYAPSVEVLSGLQARAAQAGGHNLYAVINPEEDPSLVFTSVEGAAIRRLFDQPEIHEGPIGTKEAIKSGVVGRAYLHFSCHGVYEWEEPPQSGLNVADGRLTLSDLQSGVMDMSAARLVTLSACETGLTDIVKGSAEEYLGLPAGFMLAGVPCVVSSLWRVSDLSTAMLMERFYLNHLYGDPDEGPETRSPLPPAEALRRAQVWLRDKVTVQEAAERCDAQIAEFESREEDPPEWLSLAWRKYAQIARKTPYVSPFAHPYHWAAFALYGATQDSSKERGENSHA